MPQSFSKRSFAKKDYQLNYLESNIGWEKALYIACAAAFGIFGAFVSPFDDHIQKLLPFSFGKPRQGAYFPPHCRYITPYEDIVREHKKKQRESSQFRGRPDADDIE